MNANVLSKFKRQPPIRGRTIKRRYLKKWMSSHPPVKANKNNSNELLRHYLQIIRFSSRLFYLFHCILPTIIYVFDLFY